MTPSPEQPRRWSAGAIVGGRYRLLGPIGAGAMGEVWRAEHVSLGTHVAVKLVDPTWSGDPKETLARFLHEARAAALLKSPHVVQILDHGAEGSFAYIAMELLEGESLDARIERAGRLPPARVARIVAEIARAIGKAHDAGIVHRDLKPPNVFLARADGREIVKVLDFGIAKTVGGPRDPLLQTHAGVIVGTPSYMSPEQVLANGPLDGRTDLWSLGAIAYECMTGTRPFPAVSLGDLFMRICTQPAPPPSSLAPVPGGFDAWCARALAKDPAQRFASAQEMADALRAIAAPPGSPEANDWAPELMTDPRGQAPALDGSKLLLMTGSSAWASQRAERRGPSRRTLMLAGLVGAPLGALLAGAILFGVVRARHSGGEPAAAASAVAAAGDTSASAAAAGASAAGAGTSPAAVAGATAVAATASGAGGNTPPIVSAAGAAPDASAAGASSAGGARAGSAAAAASARSGSGQRPGRKPRPDEVLGF